MNIRYLCKPMKIDERTKDYIEKRLKGIERILDKILQVEVEIDLDKKGKFRVELIVRTPYEMYRTEETSDSIEASVDVAVEEIKGQIIKDKEKIKTLKKRGGLSLKKKMALDENSRF